MVDGLNAAAAAKVATAYIGVPKKLFTVKEWVLAYLKRKIDLVRDTEFISQRGERS